MRRYTWVIDERTEHPEIRGLSLSKDSNPAPSNSNPHVLSHDAVLPPDAAIHVVGALGGELGVLGWLVSQRRPLVLSISPH